VRKIPDPVNCSVREGLFVDPCSSLQAVIGNNVPGFSKAKGVFLQTLHSRTIHEMTRQYVGIKSKQHPNGFLFNFCPFCGTDISAPFMPKDDVE